MQNTEENVMLPLLIQLRFRYVKQLKMSVWTSVLWKILMQLATKLPEVVLKRPFLIRKFWEIPSIILLVEISLSRNDTNDSCWKYIVLLIVSKLVHEHYRVAFDWHETETFYYLSLLHWLVREGLGPISTYEFYKPNNCPVQNDTLNAISAKLNCYRRQRNGLGIV